MDGCAGVDGVEEWLGVEGVDGAGVDGCVAGGVVWTIDRSGGTLHGYDPATGRDAASAELGDAIAFPTPAAAGSLLVAPAGATVVAFRGFG